MLTSGRFDIRPPFDDDDEDRDVARLKERATGGQSVLFHNFLSFLAMMTKTSCAA
jgi:hypothetical protein